MYDMQTLHAGGIPMFRGTYLVYYCVLTPSTLTIVCILISFGSLVKVFAGHFEYSSSIDRSIKRPFMGTIHVKSYLK